MDKALSLLFLILLLLIIFRRRPASHGRRRIATPQDEPVIQRRAPKPEWVRLEIIRLKALMPGTGCRKLAETFNRRFAERGETVGKTYVSGVVRKHRHEIEAQRRKVRNRRHRPTIPNRVWGLDLTFVTDERGKPHPVLGILDHGTRANLVLTPLQGKSALALLRFIAATITLYGKPKAIRTDNEGMFKSWLFSFTLWAWGIRHQRTDAHCPWQNGRIERFFGTLKEKLAGWSVTDIRELDVSLRLYRAWYNHVRPHQHLLGMTPAEAWARMDLRHRPIKEAIWFDAWDGLLTGYHIRR